MPTYDWSPVLNSLQGLAQGFAEKKQYNDLLTGLLGAAGAPPDQGQVQPAQGMIPRLLQSVGLGGPRPMGPGIIAEGPYRPPSPAGFDPATHTIREFDDPGSGSPFGAGKMGAPQGPGGQLIPPQYAEILRRLPPQVGMPLLMQMVQGSMTPQAPIKVGANERLIDPRTREQIVGPVDPQRARRLSPEEATQIGLPQGTVAYEKPDGTLDIPSRPDLVSPEREAQLARIAAAGRTQITNNVGQQRAFDAGIGGAQAERVQGFVQAADVARGKIDMLSALGPALADAPFAGPLAERLTDAAQLMNQLGISATDTAGAEAARALSNQMTMMMRNPAGGAGMPGAMSDADRNFLRQTVPGLGNSRGGARRMIEIATRMEQRKIEVADLAQRYAEEHGKLDSGFDKVLKDYADANPMFMQESGGLPTPRSAAERDRLAPGTRYQAPDGSVRVR